MIRSRVEALGILGLSDNASTEQIKSAYRAACKNCHPDSMPVNCDAKIVDELQARYRMISEAYDYLNKNKYVQETRILGDGNVAYREKTNRYRKEQLDKEVRERKQKRYQELQEEGRKLRQQEEAGKILDEIRWMRVADIIRGTIKEDRKRKELEEKISEAIRKKQ